MNISARATRKVAVLLIEENVPCARLHQAYLSGIKAYQFDVFMAHSGSQALDLIKQNSFDLVLLNLQCTDLGGLELFNALAPYMQESACVILTETGSLTLAVDAMRMGAKDFIIKPVSSSKLCSSILRVLEQGPSQMTAIEQNPQSPPVEQKVNTDMCASEGFVSFIGGSGVMQDVYQTIQKAAPSDAPVFITGLSGTGKELCAEAIHKASPRAHEPFIALNCSALPKDLIESEIFGHEKGAFTGAHKTHIGAAEQADGGVLFLDEICEMDLCLQAKLLRFIQTGEIKPVGSDQTKRVNVRFICATNKSPQESVANGTFREDLFYRLHVLPITLPPLRERGDDSVKIATHMLQKFASEEGKNFEGLTPEAAQLIQNYEWPGNVRQLLNVMRHIVVMNTGGLVTTEMLAAADISPRACVNTRRTPVNFCAETDLSGYGSSVTTPSQITPMWQAERDIIENAILACDGNVVEAAHHLQISPSTIYRKRQGWMPHLRPHSAHKMALAH